MTPEQLTDYVKSILVHTRNVSADETLDMVDQHYMQGKLHALLGVASQLGFDGREYLDTIPYPKEDDNE